jgi:hypothetical protein
LNEQLKQTLAAMADLKKQQLATANDSDSGAFYALQKQWDDLRETITDDVRAFLWAVMDAYLLIIAVDTPDTMRYVALPSECDDGSLGPFYIEAKETDIFFLAGNDSETLSRVSELWIACLENKTEK